MNVHQQGLSRSRSFSVRQWTHIVAALVIIACLLLIARLLPMDRAATALSEWVEGLGVWGPVIFAGCYVVATVFMLPGSALTLAAGAVFGLATGTATVSVGSTLGAACAFLISRYVARPSIERRLANSERFQAVDAAIKNDGWKIVALLRLSPAIPFNLQNYLYGLTAIRFWPYVISSWLAMLPGTFMYVYLGYAGRASVAAAAGADRPRTPLEWIMLAVGLVATIVVTVYVTRIARRALKRRSAVSASQRQGSSQKELDVVKQSPSVSGRLASAFLVLTACFSVASTVFVYANPSTIQSWFGPPQVTLQESYSEKSTGSEFEHAALNQLLQSFVNEQGGVDYARLMENRQELRTYIAALADARIEELGRSERLALLLNAYNTFTLELILDHWDGGRLASIQDIPAVVRWDAKRWKLGGKTYSLNEIEHQEIRPHFIEPRIHFALVCAAVGCPPLRNEAYVAEKLEAQLESQAIYVHTYDRWFQLDEIRHSLALTRLYDWYGGDFEQDAGSVLKFASRYSPKLDVMLGRDSAPPIQWLEYDWSLNSQENLR